MTRKSSVKRATSETDIRLDLELECLIPSEIDSGVPFFDHMLGAMAKHGRFRLVVTCQGDNEVDDHHSVEDIGIALGRALREALGDKTGITRFGDAIVPMDDALTLAALDLSGRPFFGYKGPDLSGYIGHYSEELTAEFLRSLAMNSGMNLHIHVLSGINRHHIHETVFKALGLALYKAAVLDPHLGGSVPSTKGVME